MVIDLQLELEGVSEYSVASTSLDARLFYLAIRVLVVDKDLCHVRQLVGLARR